MRVLIIEDDKKIAALLNRELQAAGFYVDCTYDGYSGLESLVTSKYDVAIVDVMLPNLDGLSIIAEARSKGIKTPVMILSAKRSVEDRVKGLETGSDDYLVKPFAFSELVARIKALIRRSQSGEEKTTEFTVGDLTLDRLNREVVRAGKKIELQPKEFALLEYLMKNQGKVISKK